MKFKFTILPILAFAILFTGCAKKDVEELQKQVEELSQSITDMQASQTEALQDEIAALEAQLTQMQNNITAGDDALVADIAEDYAELIAGLNDLSTELEENLDNIYFGDVNNDLSFTDVKASGSTIIIGNVTITKKEQLNDLSLVKTIDGDVITEVAISSAELTALETITGSLYFNVDEENALIDMANLASVIGNVELSETQVQSFNLSAIKFIGGELYVSDNPLLETLLFPMIDLIGSVYIDGTTFDSVAERLFSPIRAVDFSSTNVIGDFYGSNIGEDGDQFDTYTTPIPVPKLELGEVGGKLEIKFSAIEIFNINAERIGSLVVDYTALLYSVDFDNLVEADELNLNLGSSGGLILDFPNLVSVGSLAIHGIGGNDGKSLNYFPSLITANVINVGLLDSDYDVLEIFLQLETVTGSFILEFAADVGRACPKLKSIGGAAAIKPYGPMVVASTGSTVIYKPTTLADFVGFNALESAGTMDIDCRAASNDWSLFSNLSSLTTAFDVVADTVDHQNFNLLLTPPIDETVTLCSMSHLFEGYKNDIEHWSVVYDNNWIVQLYYIRVEEGESDFTNKFWQVYAHGSGGDKTNYYNFRDETEERIFGSCTTK